MDELKTESLGQPYKMPLYGVDQAKEQAKLVEQNFSEIAQIMKSQPRYKMDDYDSC